MTHPPSQSQPRSEERLPFALPPGLPPPSAFRPPRFLGGGDAQTLWPHVFRREAPLPGARREVWRVGPDGDGDGHRADARADGGATVGGDLSGRRAATGAGAPHAAELLDLLLLPTRPGRPGVILLHGLEAHADSRYMRGFLRAIEAAGWNGASLDFPSCGPSAPLQRGLYHGGKTDDLAAVVMRLRSLWSTDKVGALGVSLGGNVLLKYLGELGDAAPLVAAVAISVPFDLAASAARLDSGRGLSSVYREHLLRPLRRKVSRLARLPDSPLAELQPGRIRGLRTIAAFDDQVTAPMFGFASAADYWRRNSSLYFLPRIARPTLLVSAEDDPFVGAPGLPESMLARNPNLAFWLSEAGGHVGFVAGSLWRPHYFVDTLATRFLAPHLDGEARAPG